MVQSVGRAAVFGVWVALAVVLHAAPAEVPAKPSPPAEAKPVDEDDYALQRLLIDTIDQVQRNYVREVSRRRLIEAAIRGILQELDPYSDYIPPEAMDRFRSTVESEFGGIGIQVMIRDGHLMVASPLVGTPAYRAGILAGDRIVEIDGQSTAGMTIDDAVRKLKGKEGTQVTLTVIHPSATSRQTITLTREIVHVPTVLGHHRKPDDTWEYCIDPMQRIAYVRLTAFSRDTADELRKVLADLASQRLGGLVLDLRFNPGGLLSSAIEVSDLFIAQGRIVSAAGRNVRERIWEAHKEGTFEGFPMAVLVNRYSASASEIVAACLQDHHRAVIVGERTWGKGSVQNVVPLEDRKDPSGDSGPRFEARSALKLTTAGYRRPSGKNIDRAPGAKESDDWGVRPDDGFEVRLDEAEMLALLAAQRQRDVVQPKSNAKPAPEKSKPEAKAGGSQAGVAKGKRPEGEFRDRQLDKALDYLTAELARAQ